MPVDVSFRVHLRGGTASSGEPHFFRGHRLPRGSAAPDGVFASWDWDGSRVVVRNDRYGAAPLFYWSDRQQFMVSPSILALIEQGAPTALDADALAAFLRLGFFLGDDTPFAAIRAVPPNSVLEWTNGALTVSGGPPRARLNPARRDQAIDGFVELFRQAIGRRPPDGDATFVPLSGGRDSRHILFELCALGARPRCVTIPRYPPRPGEDERIAPLVARAAGAPHALLAQNSSQCAAEITKNWATHLCADEHAWYLGMIAQLGTRPRVLYDGLGGALSVPNRFHSRDSLALMEAGQTRQLADRLLAAYGTHTDQYISRLLRPDLGRAVSRDRAVERFAAELDNHADAPDPIKSFNFWNRIRRELALVPYGLMKHVPLVYTPYLDHDLYDFLMGMPATIMSPDLAAGDKSFHTEAIHRAFPQHARVPFEDKRAPQIDPRAHHRRFAAEAGRFLIQHPRAGAGLLNRSYVLPRAVCAATIGSFGEARPWFAGLTLYLKQLELAAAGVIPSSHDVSVLQAA
jgi:hypothetical protein